MDLPTLLLNLITMASIAAANETSPSSTPSTTQADISPQGKENVPAKEDDPADIDIDPPFEVNVKMLGQEIGFAPHQSPYSSFGYPMASYFYPGIPVPPSTQEITVTPNGFERDVGYMTAVIPAARTALQVVLKLFAQVGLYLVGGVALLAVGGIFTTMLCNFTPICTISFNGYDLKALNKETVRSLMTPDRIANAAAMVQEAIGKYQRLQRAVGE